MKEKWTDTFKKRNTYIVLAFVLFLAFLADKTAGASETTFEVAPGSVFIGQDHFNGAVLMIEERWDNKFSAGLGVTTTWNCTENCRRGDGPKNQFVYVQRVFEWKKIEAGIGISYWRHQTPAWSSNTPFALSIGYQFNDHLSIKLRHFSTAGVSKVNAGLDLITIGWTF